MSSFLQQCKSTCRQGVGQGTGPLQRQNLLLLCIERSVLSSVVNFQMIATFLGSIISLKQLAVVVKGKVRDDEGCNCSAYLDALQLWLFPQSEESEPNNFIWQQDGAPPH
ncbi:uncharacterized protein TNCV_1775901 [Trichonephila clavipes]|nr:uncharacterized protein TNCV_1775901 [Trichonephila clavipes]